MTSDANEAEGEEHAERGAARGGTRTPTDPPMAPRTKDREAGDAEAAARAEAAAARDEAAAARDEAAAAAERAQAAEVARAALEARLARIEAAATASPPVGAPTAASLPLAVEAARTRHDEDKGGGDDDGTYGRHPAEPVAPTEEEVYEYAAWLGMALPEEEGWLWIAYDGLVCPLPDGWQTHYTGDEHDPDRRGHVYYNHVPSGRSQWEHPNDEHARHLLMQERARRDARGDDGHEVAEQIVMEEQEEEDEEDEEQPFATPPPRATTPPPPSRHAPSDDTTPPDRSLGSATETDDAEGAFEPALSPRGSLSGGEEHDDEAAAELERWRAHTGETPAHGRHAARTVASLELAYEGGDVGADQSRASEPARAVAIDDVGASGLAATLTFELPPGWCEAFDERGQRYFVDEESGAVRWEPPSWESSSALAGYAGGVGDGRAVDGDGGCAPGSGAGIGDAGNVDDAPFEGQDEAAELDMITLRWCREQSVRLRLQKGWRRLASLLDRNSTLRHHYDFLRKTAPARRTLLVKHSIRFWRRVARDPARQVRQMRAALDYSKAMDHRRPAALRSALSRLQRATRHVSIGFRCEVLAERREKGAPFKLWRRRVPLLAGWWMLEVAERHWVRIRLRSWGAPRSADWLESTSAAAQQSPPRTAQAVRRRVAAEDEHAMFRHASATRARRLPWPRRWHEWWQRALSRRAVDLAAVARSPLLGRRARRERQRNGGASTFAWAGRRSPAARGGGRSAWRELVASPLRIGSSVAARCGSCGA